MKLQVVQERQNAAGYIGMLEGSSLFTEEACLSEDWTFQQDYAEIHTAYKLNDFF